jgi:hypothetical protein
MSLLASAVPLVSLGYKDVLGPQTYLIEFDAVVANLYYCQPILSELVSQFISVFLIYVPKVQLSASFHVTYDEVARCGRLKNLTEIREANVGTEYQR